MCTCAILRSRYHPPNTGIYSAKSGSKASRRTGALLVQSRTAGLNRHTSTVLFSRPLDIPANINLPESQRSLCTAKKNRQPNGNDKPLGFSRVFWFTWRIRKFHDRTCEFIIKNMSSDYLNRIQPGSNPTPPFNWAVTYPQPDPTKGIANK